MKSITHEEWKLMGDMEQTLWLEYNCKVNGVGGPRKIVYGVGVNDADYRTTPTIDGKQAMCPAYEAWKNILARAYCPKFHARSPTYLGVNVCNDWHKFSKFRAWWLVNQIDGYQIDKDLLSDSKEYSPDTCVFISHVLNTLTIDSGASRGECPIGVSFHKQSGRFEAHCRNPITGKREFLGLFCCQEDAHAAWMKRKLSIAIDLKGDMDAIDKRIYDRVVSIIESAR